MRYKETVLRAAMNQDRLVFISATSPLSGPFQVTGAVRALNNNKVRIALVNAKRLTRLVDDLGDDQRLTVALSAIKRVDMLWGLTYKNNQEPHGTHQINGDDALYPLLHKALSTQRLTTLDKLTSDTMIKTPEGIVLETRLSIKDRDGVIPVISQEKVFDIKAQSFIDGDTVIHYEQPLDKYFKHIPQAPRIETFKTFAVDKRVLDETPRLLFMNMAMKRNEMQRLKTWLNDAGNRPRKAYFNQLTTKNLGRKDYVIPFTKERLAMREQRAVFTALKHPVTCIDSTIDKNAFITHLSRAAVLNNCSVLVIDPDRLCKDAANEVGVLSMLSPQDSIDALERIKSSAPLNQDVSKPLAHDYDDFFDAIDDADQAALRLETVVSKLKASQTLNTFQGIVNYGSLAETLAHAIEAVSLKPITQATEPVAVVKAQVMHALQKKRQRLTTSSYKKIIDVTLIDESKSRLRALRKLLKNAFHLHQLKHVFPVMLVKDTKALAYIKHAFDLVVLMRPSLSSVLDFHYADKVAVFDGNTPCTTPYFMPRMPRIIDWFKGHIFDVFEANDNDEIKRVPMKTTPEGLVHLNHVDTKDEQGHVSIKEAETIVKRATQLENYGIYAAFVAQRKAIQTLYEGSVHGLYHSPLKPALIATSIHTNTTRETYNWLKNHPFIVSAIKDTLWPTEWYGDVDALVALSDGRDDLFSFAAETLNRHASGFDFLKAVVDDIHQADTAIFNHEAKTMTLLRQSETIAVIYFVAAYHALPSNDSLSMPHAHYISGKLRAFVLTLIAIDQKANELHVKRG